MDRREPPELRPPSGKLFRLIVIGGIVAAVIVTAASLSPRRLSGFDGPWMAPVAIIAVLMVARLAASRQALGGIGKQVLAVVAFGAALMILYSYKDDLGGAVDRALGTLVPSRGVQTAPGAMRFTADDSGQFAIDAKVDGTDIHFIVDTGASGIVLSKADAMKLGFDPSGLSFTGQFSTANGMTRGAPVTLDSIEIGPLAASHVRAWVNEGDLDESLLGMSYLTTLGRIEIKGDRMTIEQ